MKTHTASPSLWTALAVGLFLTMACTADEAVPKPAAPPQALETLVMKKLNEIVIPMMMFENTSLEEAVDFMRIRMHELDVMEKNPANRGVNLIIRKPEGVANDDKAADAPRIHELTLNNVSASSALKYICILTDRKLSIGEMGLEISPAVNGDLGLAGQVDAKAKAQLEQRIKAITIPLIDFENVTIEEAVDFLRVKTREIDPQRGLNFIIMRKDGEREAPRIDLMVNNVTLEALLREFCKQTKHRFVVHEAAVILSPVAEKDGEKQ